MIDVGMLAKIRRMHFRDEMSLREVARNHCAPQVFPIYQRLVELEQCRRLDERARLRNPAWAHEQRARTEHSAIERGQIRRTLPGWITDQELMLEQKRFCGDGTYTTWAEQPRERDQQVDGEDKEFAHGANRTMIASARKSARHRWIPSCYEFATDRLRTIRNTVSRERPSQRPVNVLTANAGLDCGVSQQA